MDLQLTNGTIELSLTHLMSEQLQLKRELNDNKVRLIEHYTPDVDNPRHVNLENFLNQQNSDPWMVNFFQVLKANIPLYEDRVANISQWALSCLNFVNTLRVNNEEERERRRKR